jgi:hypothetical protein
VKYEANATYVTEEEGKRTVVIYQPVAFQCTIFPFALVAAWH